MAQVPSTMPQPHAPVSSSDPLSGWVERVTYHNEETGYAVLRVKVQGKRSLATVVGSLPCVSPGEWLVAEGAWIQDREHGLQFKARLLKSSPPTSPEGIEKYLGSGLMKGIGPVYARKMVAKFGEDIFRVIDQYSVRLEEIDGIGPERRRRIKTAWAEQKLVREIMVFLHSHRVSTSRAVRIHKVYGDAAIEKVRGNPYALIEDIPGIGFLTADQIAQEVSIPRTSMMRVCAGLRHLLLEATRQGHCALPRDLLVQQGIRLLNAETGSRTRASAPGAISGAMPCSSPAPSGAGPSAPRDQSAASHSVADPPIDESMVIEAMNQMLVRQEVMSERIDDRVLVFHLALQKAEQVIAGILLRLVAQKPLYPSVDLPRAIAWCQTKTGKELAVGQQEALAMALAHRTLIVTGGPGVGKTTLINSLLRILKAKGVQCLLCAPTGRAAKRLAETTGWEAKTIHRLLEFNPGQHDFSRNPDRPLECGLLVVDEVSMVDVLLMHKLLRALPEGASLVLVGDVDQLPSVGPGMVLRHLIDSQCVPVAKLTRIFRQAEGSRIVVSAHQVNEGRLPEPAGKEVESDFFFLERLEPETIGQTVIELASKRLPAKYGWNPTRDIQVLCPMNRGTLGTRELNSRLQAALNPPVRDAAAVERFGWHFRAGDKVIQTENNYDKEVFNGDIGIISAIDLVDQALRIDFDGREVSYDFGELDEISLAYAITIHKSQGSEFPVVIIPLAMQQYLLLQRNLIYTGLTRGKKLVVIVGQRKAFQMAVRNARAEERYSGLLARLKERA
jgi:exodeoxyribonuclease V alpha subunit